MFTNLKHFLIFSFNKFELSFYQDENTVKQKFLTFEVVKIDSDKVVDLLIYEKNYVLIQKKSSISR